MKICIECKWYVEINGCRYGLKGKMNPVDGSYHFNFQQCNEMRSGQGTCGPNGKFWERKRGLLAKLFGWNDGAEQPKD